MGMGALRVACLVGGRARWVLLGMRILQGSLSASALVLLLVSGLLSSLNLLVVGLWTLLPVLGAPRAVLRSLGACDPVRPVSGSLAVLLGTGWAG